METPTTGVAEFHRRFSRLGGEGRAKKLSATQRSQIASHAARTRWDNIETRTTKLTGAQVLAIRSAYAAGRITLAQLGAQYGVTDGAIWRVVRRKTWRHI